MGEGGGDRVFCFSTRGALSTSVKRAFLHLAVDRCETGITTALPSIAALDNGAWHIEGIDVARAKREKENEITKQKRPRVCSWALSLGGPAATFFSLTTWSQNSELNPRRPSSARAATPTSPASTPPPPVLLLLLLPPLRPLPPPLPQATSSSARRSSRAP